MHKAKETAGKTAKTGAATRKGTNTGKAKRGRPRIDYSQYKLPPPPKGFVMPPVATRKGTTRKGNANMRPLPTELNPDATYTLKGANLMALMGAARLEEKGIEADTILRYDLDGVKLSDEQRANLRERADRHYMLGQGTLKEMIAELRPVAAKPAPVDKRLADIMKKRETERLADAWPNSPKVKRSFFWLDGETLAGVDLLARNRGLKSRSATLARVIAAEVRAPVEVDMEADEIGAAAIAPKHDLAAYGHIGGEGWPKFRALGRKRRQDADELVEAIINKARLLDAVDKGEANRAKRDARP